MRGNPDRQDAIYHTFSVEDLIEPEHPLRPIKRMVDTALAGMSRTFRAAYSDTDRPGVPPETLLKALLLQCLYTIRSERELCRRLRTDLLFRWFLDLQPSDEVFDHSVFTHNRDRLATHGITQKIFDSVVKQAIEAGLTSDEHFTVDGSLIQSHASLKSLKKIEREASEKDDGDPPSASPGRNPSVDFKGQRRVNATHRSPSGSSCSQNCQAANAQTSSSSTECTSPGGLADSIAVSLSGSSSTVGAHYVPYSTRSGGSGTWVATATGSRSTGGVGDLTTGAA